MKNKMLINQISYFVITNVFFYFFLLFFFNKPGFTDCFFCISPLLSVCLLKDKKAYIKQERKIHLYQIILFNCIDLTFFIMGMLCIMLFSAIFYNKWVIKILVDIFICIFFAKNFLFISAGCKILKIGTNLVSGYIYKNLFESILIIMLLSINVSFLFSLIAAIFYVADILFLFIKKKSFFDRIFNISYFSIK